MMTAVGDSSMARAPEDQPGYGHLIEFVVHPSLPGKVWDGKQALARPDRWEDQPSKQGDSSS
jgi:hypothetical protein